VKQCSTLRQQYRDAWGAGWGLGVMSNRYILLAAMFLLFWTSYANAAGPQPPMGKVGNWQTGAYTNDATGAFSHCVGGTNYLGGIYFAVSVNRNFQWSLGFAHQSWQLTPGQTIPVDLTFDNRSQFHVFARVLLPHFVEVQMPNDSQLIRQFRQATMMTAFTSGNLFQFNLLNTSQLLPVLVNCVRQKLGMPTVAGAQPKQTQSPPVAMPEPAQPPPVVPSTLNPDNADLHLEAMELATNFILNSQLRSPKVLGASETPNELKSTGAVWRSSDSAGIVKIIPEAPNQKGINVAAAVAAADSKECRGKFMSGRISELVDSDVVSRGFSTCEDSAGLRFGQYFIVPRKQGGFAVFSVVSQGTTEKPTSGPKDEQLTTFRKAALNAVGP
jgi:hypothetical protein